MVNIKSLFDKATNPDHSEPDWETILEIVEEVKTKGVTVKNVVKEIRRKLLDSDPTVVFYSLLVLDSLMKNCSSDLHSEVLSSEFMNVLKGVITSSKDGRNAKAVDKALELIGEWKVAFGSQSGYKAVHSVFGELEREGYHIPEAEVASAAFIKKAPEWVMGERCFMCRQEFSKLKGNFRHHCRNCGKSVCAQCSSKKVPLPHYGVDQPARVCDLCYRDVDKPSTDRVGDSGDLPPEYLQSSLAHESQQPPSRNPDLQVQEDDDLQMAIAMSLNEQENKKQSAPARSVTPPLSTAPSAPPPPTSTLYSTIVHDTSSSAHAPTQTNRSAEPYLHGNDPTEETEADPNLARYLNRSYWEERKEKQRTGATPTATPPVSSSNDVGPQAVALTANTVGSPLAESVRKTIELFLQRLHEVNAAGGSVATDPIVLSLYQNLNALQPQLLKQIDDIQQQKAHQERILQKLNEAKQARVSLNSMRHKHVEKLKQQEKEQAMLARMQMEQKLALLRQQKQEQDDYHQTLQQKRLDVLHSQRSEYEHQLQVQREMERQQLIMQEQQVLQQQFGGGTVVQPQPQPQMQPQMHPQMQHLPHATTQPQMQPQMQPPQIHQLPHAVTQPRIQQPQYGRVSPVQHTQPQYEPTQMQPQYGRVSPVQHTQPQYEPAQMQPQYGRVSPVQHTQPQYEPAQPHQFQPAVPPSLAPASLPLQSLSIHDPTQASPLPPKLDHNPNADPALPPPPYQPMSLQTDGGAYQSYPTQFQPTSQSFAPQPTTSLLDTNLTSFQPLSLSGSPQTFTSQPASLVQPAHQPASQTFTSQPASLVQPAHQPPPPQSIQPQSLTQPQFGPPQPQGFQPQGFQQPTQVFTPQQHVGYSTGYQQQYAETPQQFHPGMTQGGSFQGQESEPPLITFD